MERGFFAHLDDHERQAIAFFTCFAQFMSLADILSATVINERCRQTSPCSGHQGVRLQMSDGTSKNITCGSYDIAMLLYGVHGKIEQPCLASCLTTDMKECVDKYNATSIARACPEAAVRMTDVYTKHYMSYVWDLLEYLKGSLGDDAFEGAYCVGDDFEKAVGPLMRHLAGKYPGVSSKK